MRREHLAVEFPRIRLTRADGQAMLHAIFHLTRPVRREFWDTLYQRTGGNPFFVEEGVQSLVMRGDEPSAGARRLEPLP